MRLTNTVIGAVLLIDALSGTMQQLRIEAEHVAIATYVQRVSPQEPLTDQELFSRLHERHDWQQSHLSEFSVTRTYTVHNRKGEVVGQEVVTMKYTPPGSKAFTVISSAGSPFVRTHVFERLMARETAKTQNQDDSDELITPENYKLEISGRKDVGFSDCFVVHATPKHKTTDLFEGDIWVDSHDFAIVRIAGHLAKSPSFWIKHVEFDREYEKIGGFFVLERETAIANIRIYGSRTLTVDCKEYAFRDIHAAEPTQSGAFERKQDHAGVELKSVNVLRQWL